MRLEAIYDKYRKGDPLTDLELAYAIPRLRDAEKILIEMGDTFNLARKEITMTLQALIAFKEARKGGQCG